MSYFDDALWDLRIHIGHLIEDREKFKPSDEAFKKYEIEDFKCHSLSIIVWSMLSQIECVIKTADKSSISKMLRTTISVIDSFSSDPKEYKLISYKQRLLEVLSGLQRFFE